MRELRLRYFIDLVSNIEAKANSHAHALATAQGKIEQALGKTNASLSGYERLLLRVGRVGDSSLQRQGQYFATIAQNALRAQQTVQKYVDTAAKAGRVALNVGQGAAQGGAALAAGAYVAKTALDKPIDYDTRLRRATTTAFAGQDIVGLLAGFKELGALIDGTVRNVSGASRDSTLGAYEKLVGTGSFTKNESAQLLPGIMKTSVASGAEANDLVLAAEKLKMGELKLKTEDIPTALAKIMRAGQEGGFEIKDASKFIGPLVPLMKGYKGLAGLESLVTMLQQVRSTSGTNDEAANNLKNFLQKIPADSTRKDFKKQGIDLDKEMVAGALKGMTPVDAYMGALDKVMAKQDPEGKARAAMRKADKAATPEQKKDQYDRISEIYKSAGISKIINDIQEFGGYSGLAGTKEYGAKVLGAVQSEKGEAVTTGYQFMTEGTGAKATDVANRKDIAMSDLLGSQGGALNAGLDKVVKLTDEFPKTTAAAAGAAVALTALAAASGVAALVGGKGVGGAAAGGAAKAAGGWLASGAGKLSALFTAGATRLGLGGFAGGASSTAAAGGAAAGVGAAAGTIARVASKATLPLAAAAGAYEVGRLALAVGDLAMVKNRDGVQLTPEAQARLAGTQPAAPLDISPSLQVPGLELLTVAGKAPAASLARPGPAVMPLGPLPAAAMPVLPKPAPNAAPRAESKPQASDFARDVLLRSMQGSAFAGVSPAARPSAPPDFLSLTAPGAAAQNINAGSKTEIKVGEGVLNVRITVDDSRVQVSPAVSQQPSLIRINAGSTNPGGFR